MVKIRTLDATTQTLAHEEEEELSGLNNYIGDRSLVAQRRRRQRRRRRLIIGRGRGRWKTKESMRRGYMWTNAWLGYRRINNSIGAREMLKIWVHVLVEIGGGHTMDHPTRRPFNHAPGPAAAAVLSTYVQTGPRVELMKEGNEIHGLPSLPPCLPP
jgi:hypothetical protein